MSSGSQARADGDELLQEDGGDDPLNGNQPGRSDDDDGSRMSTKNVVKRDIIPSERESLVPLHVSQSLFRSLGTLPTSNEQHPTYQSFGNNLDTSLPDIVIQQPSRTTKIGDERWGVKARHLLEAVLPTRHEGRSRRGSVGREGFLRQVWAPPFISTSTREIPAAGRARFNTSLQVATATADSSADWRSRSLSALPRKTAPNAGMLLTALSDDDEDGDTGSIASTMEKRKMAGNGFDTSASSHKAVLGSGNGSTSSPISDATADSTLLMGSSQNNNGEPQMSKKKRYFQLILLCCVMVTCGTCFSLFAPFFPEEAAKRGMSSTTVGFVFGSYQLIIFATSPLFGRFLTGRLGLRYMVCGGLVLCGGATILFGFLDRAPAGTVYAVLCFVARIIEACGTSLFTTAAFAFGATLLPDDMALVYGLLEMSNGVGCCIGPPIGGLLYKVGGFTLPFLLLGCVMLCLSVVVACILKNQVVRADVGESNVSLMQFFREPRIILIFFVETCCSLTFQFIDPTLAPFMKSEAGIDDPVLVGVIFFIAGLTYTACCVISGRVLDKRPNSSYIFAACAALVACIGCTCLGPAPFLPWSPTMGSIIATCIVMFGGLGSLLIPLAKLYEITADEIIGLDTSSIQVNALISGIYNSSWFLGGFIGPSLVGGFAVDMWGFVPCATAMGGLEFLVSLILFGLAFFEFRRRKKLRERRPAFFAPNESL